jgi:hypothetical protein
MPPSILINPFNVSRRNIRRDAGGGSVVASTLMILTCLVLGLLAGGMLVIGVALVSFWKSLAPSDFQAWFAAHAHLVGRLMIPQGVGAIAVTAAAVAACWRGSVTRAGRCWGLGCHRHLLNLNVHVRVPALEDGTQLPVERLHARL